MPKFLTAKEARQASETMARSLDNGAGIDHIYKLVEDTSRLGFNKIVVTILPDMLEYVQQSFPDYRIEEVAYREPLHPEKLNILIIW